MADPIVLPVAPPPVAVVTAPVAPTIPAGWAPHPTAPGYYHNGTEALLLADLLARAAAPIEDTEAVNLFTGIQAGKVTGLTREQAKRVLAVRTERYPQPFRVNGIFEPGEVDTATIVPDKKGNEIRTKTGNGKSKTNLYYQLRSTTKVGKNGKPVEYGVSILDDAQTDFGANGQIIQTKCIELPLRPGEAEDATRTHVMNFA